MGLTTYFLKFASAEARDAFEDRLSEAQPAVKFRASVIDTQATVMWSEEALDALQALDPTMSIYGDVDFQTMRLKERAARAGEPPTPMLAVSD